MRTPSVNTACTCWPMGAWMDASAGTTATGNFDRELLAGPGAPAGVDHVNGSWLRACMLRFMPTQGAVSHGCMRA